MRILTCKNCQRYVPIENEDLGLCATCNQFFRDQDYLYSQVSKAFIAMCIRSEMECPRCRRPVDQTFTVHHKAGRIGYADKWAKDLGITRLLDVRFFLAIDLACHQYIETHPAIAKARGWSIGRLGISQSPIPEKELDEISAAVAAYKIKSGSSDLSE